MPKNAVKFTKNRLIVVNEISREIECCLKRDRDIGRTAVLSDVKTAFVCAAKSGKLFLRAETTELRN